MTNETDPLAPPLRIEEGALEAEDDSSTGTMSPGELVPNPNLNPILSVETINPTREPVTANPTRDDDENFCANFNDFMEHFERRLMLIEERNASYFQGLAAREAREEQHKTTFQTETLETPLRSARSIRFPESCRRSSMMILLRPSALA